MTPKNTISGNDISDEPGNISLDNLNLTWPSDAHPQNEEPDTVEHDEENDPVKGEFIEDVETILRGLKDLCWGMGEKLQDE